MLRFQMTTVDRGTYVNPVGNTEIQVHLPADIILRRIKLFLGKKSGKSRTPKRQNTFLRVKSACSSESKSLRCLPPYLWRYMSPTLH